MRISKPIHPGEILSEEFMVPFGLSANKLAHSLGVPANRIPAIINGTRSITADTALRLATAFGTTPDFWMNLQSQYALENAALRSKETIEKTVEIIAVPAYA